MRIVLNIAPGIAPGIAPTFMTLLALFSMPALAQQKLLPAQSEIVFVSKQMGVPVEGRFKRFDATVQFDPAKPEAARINMTIDMASVSLGSPESEAELPKASWFNTGKFAQASFQSSSVKSLGVGKFEINGKLNIKGQQRDVLVPISLAQAGPLTTATGQLTLQRLAFKIGENEWADTSMVADAVQVKFKFALQGVAKF
jgi:polyisoprenoid-binding protein YceI